MCRKREVYITLCPVPLLVCILAASNGNAEESTEVEAFALEPQLGLELRYDDNIFQSVTDVQSSWITLLSPSLSVVAQPKTQRYEFQYVGQVAHYMESDADDYDDHYVEGAAYLALGRRSTLDIIGSYDNSHENRGTGLTEGLDPSGALPQSPDEYRLATILGRLGFGSNTSNGQLVLEGFLSELDYNNHVQRTRFFDRNRSYVNGAFYYRVLPKTSILIETQITDIAYEQNRGAQPTLDSTENRYLVGVRWDTTSKVSGTAKIGYVQKDFSASARDDFSEPSWEVDVRWSPRTYSHFDLHTSRYPSESTTLGSFVDNTVYSVAWEHVWSGRLKSRVGTRYLDQDYRGGTVDRRQRLTQYNALIEYEMRRWLTWVAGVRVNSRNSNVVSLVFDGTVYNLGVLLKM